MVISPPQLQPCAVLVSLDLAAVDGSSLLFVSILHFSSHLQTDKLSVQRTIL